MNHHASPNAVPAQIAHAQELVRRLGEPLLGGNQASVVVETEAARTALMGALARATDHVNLDAALLRTPGLQDDLLNGLAALCRQGVRVQLLAGAAHRAPDATLDSLFRLGATVKRLAPASALGGWMERRAQPLQRQLAVFDGRVAWLGPGLQALPTGGPAPHVCVRGPIVQRLQRLFLGTGTVTEPWSPPPPQARHFPPIALSGRQRMGLAHGTPFGSPLLGALETARFSIFIALSRRAPSRRLVQAIATAARRGVSVSVLLQNGALHTAPWRSSCTELMRAGAWLYQGDAAHTLPSHCIVDGVWSSVAIDGGTGWQSGGVVDAPQLIVLDPAFASELDGVCQAVMAQAMLLDARSLAAPTPLQRWLRPAPSVGRGTNTPTTGDHAITSVRGSVEGPGLSP